MMNIEKQMPINKLEEIERFIKRAKLELMDKEIDPRSLRVSMPQILFDMLSYRSRELWNFQQNNIENSKIFGLDIQLTYKPEIAVFDIYPRVNNEGRCFVFDLDPNQIFF